MRKSVLLFHEIYIINEKKCVPVSWNLYNKWEKSVFLFHEIYNKIFSLHSILSND